MLTPISSYIPMTMIEALKIIAQLKQREAEYNVGAIYPFDAEFANMMLCEDEDGNVVYMFYPYRKELNNNDSKN